MNDWDEARLVLERVAPSMDALHILAGVFLLLGFSLLLRRRVSSAWPWLAVLAAAMLVQAADLLLERRPGTGTQLGQSARTLAVTMLLPTLLLLSVRYLPRLYRRRPTRESGAPPAGS